MGMSWLRAARSPACQRCSKPVISLGLSAMFWAGSGPYFSTDSRDIFHQVDDLAVVNPRCTSLQELSRRPSLFLLRRRPDWEIWLDVNRFAIRFRVTR